MTESKVQYPPGHQQDLLLEEWLKAKWPNNPKIRISYSDTGFGLLPKTDNFDVLRDNRAVVFGWRPPDRPNGEGQYVVQLQPPTLKPKYKIGDRVIRVRDRKEDVVTEAIYLRSWLLRHPDTGETEEIPARWAYRVEGGFGGSLNIMFSEGF